MTNEYDIVVIGGGPTALTIFEHYSRNNRSAKGLLIITRADQGAYTKGAKTVHSIVPKLPVVNMKNIGIYEQILDMKNIAEILLRREFKPSTSYLENPSFGFRCCTDQEEFQILQSVPNFFSRSGASITQQTALFLQAHLGRTVDPGLLFPYGERIWNVSGYMDIYLSKINQHCILTADSVVYKGNKGSSTELIALIDGRPETIYAARVIVCLGTGNIEFERNVQLQKNDAADHMRFKILTYYKCIYVHESNLPQKLSSIIIPEDGLCVTNELAGRQSLTYNTNSPLHTVAKFTQEFLNSRLKDSRSKISNLYPFIYQNSSNDFVCSMPVDPDAYHDKPENHFRFIISHSVDSTIRYYNLSYFTAIIAAVNDLSGDLNSF